MGWKNYPWRNKKHTSLLEEFDPTCGQQFICCDYENSFNWNILKREIFVCLSLCLLPFTRSTFNRVYRGFLFFYFNFYFINIIFIYLIY